MVIDLSVLPPALSKAFDRAVAAVRGLAEALDRAGVPGSASDMHRLALGLDGPKRRWAAGCIATKPEPQKPRRTRRGRGAKEKLDVVDEG